MMIRNVQDQNKLEPISKYAWLCAIKQDFLKYNDMQISSRK